MSFNQLFKKLKAKKQVESVYFNSGALHDAYHFNIIDRNEELNYRNKRESKFSFPCTAIFFYRTIQLIIFSSYLIVWTLFYPIRLIANGISNALLKLSNTIINLIILYENKYSNNFK